MRRFSSLASAWKRHAYPGASPQAAPEAANPSWQRSTLFARLCVECAELGDDLLALASRALDSLLRVLRHAHLDGEAMAALFT